ncbi:hypothetical protein, partial [Mesorhizobium sp. M7A.F.Ca.AU.002.02.1.1]|uniref:hypothetical protein n=1 Tax=Mesorhizobium sp. M7A.F.Ca.AU.002.02.1.1 TaxID=2496671 RepID=UPI0019D29932
MRKASAPKMAPMALPLPPNSETPPSTTAAIGGLFLTFFTYTGEAAYASGNSYTLFSIAASRP